VQVPDAFSVQVVGEKVPPTPPATPKVTMPPVTTPPVPLSVAVIPVTPVVEPKGAETGLTVTVVGAIVVIVSVLLALAAE
jgi:hypothetical protein